MKFYGCPDCLEGPVAVPMGDIAMHMVNAHGWGYECAIKFLKGIEKVTA